MKIEINFVVFSKGGRGGGNKLRINIQRKTMWMRHFLSALNEKGRKWTVCPSVTLIFTTKISINCDRLLYGRHVTIVIRQNANMRPHAYTYWRLMDTRYQCTLYSVHWKTSKHSTIKWETNSRNFRSFMGHMHSHKLSTSTTWNRKTKPPNRWECWLLVPYCRLFCAIQERNRIST